MYQILRNSYSQLNNTPVNIKNMGLHSTLIKRRRESTEITQQKMFIQHFQSKLSPQEQREDLRRGSHLPLLRCSSALRGQFSTLCPELCNYSCMAGYDVFKEISFKKANDCS